MEQGSCLNEDADISDFTEVNLSVPDNVLGVCDVSPYGTIWPSLLRDTSANLN